MQFLMLLSDALFPHHTSVHSHQARLLTAIALALTLAQARSLHRIPPPTSSQGGAGVYHFTARTNYTVHGAFLGTPWAGARWTYTALCTTQALHCTRRNPKTCTNPNPALGQSRHNGLKHATRRYNLRGGRGAQLPSVQWSTQ